MNYPKTLHISALENPKGYL